MAKTIKLKNETYLEGNSINVGFKRQDLEFYLNNREPHYMYNSTGNPGWYRILHLKHTAGWGSACIFFTIQTINADNIVGVCSIQYYNNETVGARIISGNISADGIQYKKNSDNTLDVYFYTASWYVPLLICPTYVFSSNNVEWDIWQSTGYINSFSGGTNFVKI